MSHIIVALMMVAGWIAPVLMLGVFFKQLLELIRALVSPRKVAQENPDAFPPGDRKTWVRIS